MGVCIVRICQESEFSQQSITCSFGKTDYSTTFSNKHRLNLLTSVFYSRRVQACNRIDFVCELEHIPHYDTQFRFLYHYIPLTCTSFIQPNTDALLHAASFYPIGTTPILLSILMPFVVKSFPLSFLLPINLALEFSLFQSNPRKDVPQLEFTWTLHG